MLDETLDLGTFLLLAWLPASVITWVLRRYHNVGDPVLIYRIVAFVSIIYAPLFAASGGIWVWGLFMGIASVVLTEALRIAFVSDTVPKSGFKTLVFSFPIMIAYIAFGPVLQRLLALLLFLSGGCFPLFLSSQEYNCGIARKAPPWCSR
ncbi:MAG: hypothetical protein GYB68_06325 [Chloroflexi bacterium]|nr:hypothetical protein [Chloroflexota bacterium]